MTTPPSARRPHTPRALLSHRFLAFLAVLLAAGGLHGADEATPVAVPRYTHPGAGQVCYFLLTDRFANGKPGNDTGGLAGGPEVNGFDPTRISHYHGGDLAGLIGKLDYIKGLGATAIWVTPPMVNKAVQRGSAAYHGYWILDFLHVDPHLGTDADFHELVAQAHARGMRVYLDIVVNHTADVIHFAGNQTTYVPRSAAPYRDAGGKPFDERAVAYNGLNDPALFPALSAARSFPYAPIVPPAEAHAKNPDWLNNPIYYHNRGNSLFRGESSLEGDFGGLDDTFTEHPDVVRGFIDIYRHWLDDYQVDGFRIDTAKHVNVEFWQAFAPALREEARRAGRPWFIQFGEALDPTVNVPFLSEFSLTAGLDAALDFGFMHAAIAYVSQGRGAGGLDAFFALDDCYTGPAGNVHTAPTFLGNHDLGRFGYFLQRDNPKATRDQLAALELLGHGLLFLARGQPVLYYGDEQGMIGRGGGDMQAREDMFASRSPDFRIAPLLGTTRTGADDKFDPQHPFYRAFRDLITLREAHPALNRGAMLVRPVETAPSLFAFSRIERGEKVEYLAAFNNSRTETVTAHVPTSQPAGASLERLYSSPGAAEAASALTADAQGNVAVTLAPLHFALWRATAPLPVPARGPSIALTTPAAGATLRFPLKETDGHEFPVRQEIHAEVGGGDGLAEVTFTMTRSSRPGQVELLGTDDAAPYRVFWRPPPDLVPGEELAFTATVDDLRGHQAAARVAGIKVAPDTPVFGLKGGIVPVIKEAPPAALTVAGGGPLSLSVRAEGTGPLTYQWLRDGLELPGATAATYALERAGAAAAGRYRVLVRGLAGTVLSPECTVAVPAATAGRIETLPALPSRHVPSRRVDVWLPPGYDDHPQERYAVLYMHDGQNLFDTATGYGGQTWEVDQAVCRLMQAGKIRGVIIVGVWNTGMGRFPEYMPQKPVTTPQLSLYPGGPTVEGATLRSDAYLRFLVEELKPAIDRAYRTLPDAAHTAVMGSSMGGLISGYALVEYPAVFGRAGCVSTHFPAGNGIVVDYFARHLPAPGAHRLYFDYGTATLDAMYEPFQLKMDAAMRAAGYTDGKDWLTRKFPGDEHSERAWRRRVDIPLEFLLRP